MATIILRPISDYAIHEAYNSDGGTTNLYSYVDEEVASDTDYVYITMADDDQKALFNLDTLNLPANTVINKITLHSRSYSNANRGVVVAAITSTYINVNLAPSSTSYTNRSVDVLLDDNEDALTVAKINLCKIGAIIPQEGPSKANIYISQIYLEVDYTEEEAAGNAFFFGMNF